MIMNSVTHPLTHKTQLIHPLTHKLIPSTHSQFTHKLIPSTHSLTQSPIHYSLTQSSTYKLTIHSLTQSPIHSLTITLTQSPIHSLTINLITHLFTHNSLIHSLTHSQPHPLTHFLSVCQFALPTPPDNRPPDGKNSNLHRLTD